MIYDPTHPVHHIVNIAVFLSALWSPGSLGVVLTVCGIVWYCILIGKEVRGWFKRRK